MKTFKIFLNFCNPVLAFSSFFKYPGNQWYIKRAMGGIVYHTGTW